MEYIIIGLIISILLVINTTLIALNHKKDVKEQLLEIKPGDHVFDIQEKCNAMVEEAGIGFIVLDKSFGESSTPSKRRQYIEDHGNDGRYSLSPRQLEKRLKLIKKH
jgi:hypothetical protein